MPKHSFGKMPFAARTAIVVAITVAVALILCLIMAAVALRSDDPTKNLALYGEICFGISMLICGFMGAKTSDERRFLGGIAAGGIMMLIVVAASIIFGGDGLLKEVILAALGFVICTFGAVLGSREPAHRRRR